MTDSKHGRIGRINALAYAIYESRGDPEELKKRMHFLALDISEDEVREAVEMGRWFATEAGQESLAMVRELQAKARDEQAR